MTRGEIIKDLLRKNDISVKELADYIDKSIGYVYKLMRDDIGSPDIEVLKLIAKKLEVDLNYLEGESSNILYFSEPAILDKLPQDLQDFVKNEKNAPYIVLAMSEEIMICSARTAARKIADLVNTGYLEQRNNPYNTWDRTLQYRVNFIKVISDLNELGYSLEDYPLYQKMVKDLKSPISQNDKCISQDDKCIGQIDESISQNGKSICHGGEAIPEITTEITTDNQSDQMKFDKIDDMIKYYSNKYGLPFQRVVDTYDRIIPQYKAGKIRKSFTAYFEAALEQEKKDYEINKFIE